MRLFTVALLAGLVFGAEPQGVVEVTVRDALGGSPVAGATLMLSGAALKRGTTDAAGGFRFERLPGGRFEVRVNKVGYVGSDYDGKTYRCVLKANETGRVDIALQPTAAVQGRVMGEDDEALAGVGLYAGKIPAQSDAEGRYLIEHLAAGEYSVMVRVPYETRRKTVRRLDGEEFGYGASRTPVVLAPGVRLDGFDIRLRRTRLVNLRGTVIDGATREPLHGAQVELYPAAGGLADGAYEKRAVSGPAAAFRFDLIEPQRYHLLVYRAEGLPYIVPVDAGGAEDMAVRVPAFTRLEGQVKTPGKKPVPAGMKVVLRALAPGVKPLDVPVGEDGMFVAEGVPPGRWVVDVFGSGVGPRGIGAMIGRFGPVPPSMYVAAVRFGEQSGTTAPVMVGEGANPALEITLSDKTGSLAGKVVDDKGGPVEGALVTVRETGGMSYRFTSREDGSFEAHGLPPGEYVAAAWPAGADWAKKCREEVGAKVVEGATAFVQMERCR